MTDQTPAALGENSEAELKRRIERRVALIEEAAEIAAELKEFKAEDKSDGFTEAAIADAVKLRRADPEKVLRRLLLEGEIRTYRRAAGIPTEIADAQEAAAAAAVTVPEPKSKRRRRTREDD